MSEEKQFLSVSEFGKKYNMDTGRIRRLIGEGRIHATKIGSQWIIPIDQVPPADKRIKSGKYRNWRKTDKAD